jgi:integrase
VSCQQSVASYLSDWLEIHSPGLSPSTVAGYDRTIRLHILPVCGAVPLGDLTPLDILKCLAPPRAAGHLRAAQLVLVTFRAALSGAVRLGLIDRSPADLVALPAHHARRLGYWGVDQMRAFLAAAQDDPLRPAWLLALCCGLRRGELLGLRWMDVDFGAHVVRIRNQRVRIEGVTYDRPPKSEAGRRDLAISPPLEEALRALRKQQRQLSPYVLTRDGQPLTADALRYAFRRACAAAGVPEIPLHGLRHSMASAAIDAGCELRVLQALLGHAHLSTTADIYVHPSAAVRSAALASVVRLVVQ